MGDNEDIVSAWGGVCDISHQIEGKVLDVIEVWTPLNPINAF